MKNQTASKKPAKASPKEAAAPPAKARKLSPPKTQSINLLQDPQGLNGYSSGTVFPKERVLELYRLMLLMRRFEERTGMEYRKGQIKGFCHLYIGQEAVAAGSIFALEPKDYVITAYRDHAHGLAMGLTPRELMAELMMKFSGCSKGKGGSMHFFNAKKGFFGGHGIVGGQIPLATGMGWASRYRNDGSVTLCYFGDAAMNQGVFHESLNMASLWNLPVVYICENNMVGMGTLTSRSMAVTDLYRRTAEAFNVTGIRVDGMDALAMYEATKYAVDNAREYGRPCFIEAITYRYRGHSMSDPATTYRKPDEVSIWEQRDPMVNLRKASPSILTDKVIEKMEEEILAQVEDSVQFAKSEALPPASEIWTDVYVDCPGYAKPEESPNPHEYEYRD